MPVDLLNTGTECLQPTSSANDYVECDGGLTTCPDLTNDIIENIIKEKEARDSESEDDCLLGTKNCVVWSKDTLSNISNSLKIFIRTKQCTGIILYNAD